MKTYLNSGEPTERETSTSGSSEMPVHPPPHPPLTAKQTEAETFFIDAITTVSSAILLSLN